MSVRGKSGGQSGRILLAGAALLALLAVVAGCAAALLRADWRTPYAGFGADGVFVEIPRGMPVAAIARTLETNGVVRRGISFRALALWKGHARLEAGEYRFDHAETPEQVFDTLAHGRIYTVTVTVPEGETMFGIAGLLEAKGVTSREAFLAAARAPGMVADLAPGAPSLEGFLFPATYQFPRHQPGEKIAEAMVRRFREAWAEISGKFAGNAGGAASRNGGTGPLGVVTLASLVEKETAAPEERPLVASVLRNRLRKGMTLDCDPTVIYALVLAGKYNSGGGGRLLLADLRVDSPYNTYRRRGLPPGPIANPGEASLRAALDVMLDPAPGKLLYFVATGDGGHAFSSTLAEQNRNVARYRKREAEQARSARARARAAGKPSL
ncbi:MAG TPA: endolytic transglycosylase MltG [Candidatus Acidoferrales bacterium]|nr:endolytic transglycosylase MltG [Candidatus Acidoferrales bacterium]